jgi:hypothetical protein
MRLISNARHAQLRAGAEKRHNLLGCKALRHSDQKAAQAIFKIRTGLSSSPTDSRDGEAQQQRATYWVFSIIAENGQQRKSKDHHESTKNRKGEKRAMNSSHRLFRAFLLSCFRPMSTPQPKRNIRQPLPRGATNGEATRHTQLQRAASAKKGV